MPFRRKKQPEPVPPPPALPTHFTIKGIRDSQVNTGTGSQLYYNSPVTTPAADASALADAIAALREAVRAQAAPGQAQQEALHRVDAIDRAAQAVPPDGRALLDARDWLHAALPNIATALGTVLVHPTVDTAITAAAQAVHDTAADAAKQRPRPEGGPDAPT